ncbi:uncharacterized protein [Primulina eburnea]|uniref:uncharacterized protein n=1 Tax=Primulina eburnea TaxID=1245227 RepID=UPI003C6BDE25
MCMSIPLYVTNSQKKIREKGKKEKVKEICKMASILSSFTFLSIVVVLSVLIRPSSCDSEQLINKICIRSFDFQMCHRFFRNRVYSPSMDMKGLCYIVLGKSITLIESTHTVIQILKAREPDKDIRNRYQICESNYKVLTYQLENAASAFGRGDYRSMFFNISQCDGLVSDCEIAIGSQAAQKLIKRNMKAREWISMSLAASGFLNAGH